MHYLSFLASAYGIALVALLGQLFWSLFRLRRAEKLLEEDR